MRVLIIEDDPSLARTIELTLARESLKPIVTGLGDEGIELAKIYNYDLILLDLGLPDMNGHDVLNRLRNANVRTPVLVVSGKDDTPTKVRSLGMGADDFIAKPFEREELLARIHALVRRSQGHAHSKISTGPLQVDLCSRSASIDGKEIGITGKEFEILALLSLRKGKTVTKDVFLDHLYGGLDEPEPKIVDVFICKLRKKLADASGGHRLIETIWGSGYILRDPVVQGQPKMAA